VNNLPKYINNTPVKAYHYRSSQIRSNSVSLTSEMIMGLVDWQELTSIVP